MNTREVLEVLNSSGPNYLCKYPFGNVDLYSKTVELEKAGKIKFNSFYGVWVLR